MSALGDFAQGLLGAFAGPHLAKKAREDNLRQYAIESGIRAMGNVAKHPLFVNDPEAHADILNTSMQLIQDLTNNRGRGNKKTGEPDAVSHMMQLVGNLQNKTYPSQAGVAPNQTIDATGAPSGLAGVPAAAIAPGMGTEFQVAATPGRKGLFTDENTALNRLMSHEFAKKNADEIAIEQRERAKAELADQIKVRQLNRMAGSFRTIFQSGKAEGLSDEQAATQAAAMTGMPAGYARVFSGTIGAASVKPVEIDLEDGSHVKGTWNPRTKQYFNAQNQEIPADKVTGFRPTTVTTNAEQNKEEAEAFYREVHNIDKSIPLTATQVVDSQSEYKDRLMSGGPKPPSPKYVPNSGVSIANPNLDETVEALATKYLVQDKLAFTGMGSGRKDQNKREMAVGRAMELAADLGIPWMEVPAYQEQFKANSKALTKIVGLEASVGSFEKTLEANMKLADTLSEQFSRTNLPFVNRLLAAWNYGTGGAEANNLAGQLHAVAREWAKIMQGSTSAAGVAISEAKDAEAIIGNYLSKHQLQELFQVIETDRKNRMGAIGAEKNILANRLRHPFNDEQTAPPATGGTGTPTPTPAPATTPAPAAAPTAKVTPGEATIGKVFQLSPEAAAKRGLPAGTKVRIKGLLPNGQANFEVVKQ